jgi:hypothetical protein
LLEIPPAPLIKGGEFSSSPFIRGIEGDLHLEKIDVHRSFLRSLGEAIPKEKGQAPTCPQNIEFINIKSTLISYETSLHSAQECCFFIV